MIVRAILLGSAAIIAVLLDTVVLADLQLAGVAPSTVTVMVIGVAFIDGPARGMVLGFAAGLLSDLVGEGLVGVSALLLVIAGYTIGVGRRQWTGGELSGQLLAGTLGAAGVALGQLVLELVFSQTETDLGSVIARVLVAGVFGLLLSPLIMPVVGWLSRRVPDRLTGP